MKLLATCVMLAWLMPASAWAQASPSTQPPPPPPPPSRLWIVAGGGSTTLRGHCQECGQEFPFRHGGSIVGKGGYSVSPRLDVGVELFWVEWTNESGHIYGTTFDAIAQLRPWQSKGFFVNGGAGMAFVRNFVRTLGPNPDLQQALAVQFGGGWEFKFRRRLGAELFATQHVGALGDLQTVNGAIPEVTANFWTLGAAIVIRR